MDCTTCHDEVPDANFCGTCGCDQGQTQSRVLPAWLRPRNFGAEPSEGVLRPYLVSALFPHLTKRSRRPFRIMIAIALVALLAFALLRLPAAGIAVAALGLPLLFAFYLRAARIDLDIPRSMLWIAGLSGALLGAGWVLLSGGIVSRNYGVPMSVGLALHHLLRAGLLIPTVGVALMIVPMVVVRLIWREKRDALDGFVIGALAALMFTAAATLTRLAPQFTTGLIAHARPVKGMVVEAALCGITVPITAAAAGGMVGMLLWFRHPVHAGEENDGRVRPALVLLTAVALLLHAAVGVLDIMGLPQVWMLVVHLLMTLFVLIILRICMQLALLHEKHDAIHEAQPILCDRCGHVVPDMAFCPACGAAAQATPRSARREHQAVLLTSACPAGEQEYPAYALPAGTYAAPPLRQPRFGWLLGRWGIGVATVAVALGAVALVLTPNIPHYLCPPECGRPPTGTPVMALPRFDAEKFSVAYPAPGSAYEIKTEKAGITAKLTAGDGGVMQFFSEPANGRTARQVANATVRKAYPDAKVDYEIPNAMVGYQPGFGEVADDWPQGASAAYSRIRILVMTAIKDDVALVAFATGPYHAFGPDFGPGPPSGANLQIAQDMGKYVNSFRWNGDPPR
jgi:hypothetical protein